MSERSVRMRRAIKIFLVITFLGPLVLAAVFLIGWFISGALTVSPSDYRLFGFTFAGVLYALFFTLPLWVPVLFVAGAVVASLVALGRPVRPWYLIIGAVAGCSAALFVYQLLTGQTLGFWTFFLFGFIAISITVFIYAIAENRGWLSRQNYPPSASL